jgi:hypothetical protein
MRVINIKFGEIMNRLKLIFISLITFSVLFTMGCGCSFSSGKQGPIKTVELPSPKSPSKVFGIGKAMKEGKPVLIFRQTRKPSALPFEERNFFFISKVMQSYEPKVKVIEIGNSVSYPQGDYFQTIMDYFPADGYGVIKKENNNYKLYKSTFGYSEKYDEIVVPVIKSIEKVLGPCKFKKENLIAKNSKYKGYNQAMKSGKHLILYSFAGACNSFPASKQASLESKMKTKFKGKAELVKINHKLYTDPANELYSQTHNMVAVYNAKTKKVTPALWVKQDTIKNIENALR